jgi:hypothetical protein
LSKIDVERPAKRLAQPAAHGRGVIAEQKSRHERKPAAPRACDAVGERERAAVDPDMQRGVVRADHAQLMCGDPRP